LAIAKKTKKQQSIGFFVFSHSCTFLFRAMVTLKEADGVLIPGGFGDRGIEGKILALQYVTSIDSIIYFTHFRRTSV
jgi:CTP synthase (UTP-ammonia lyase)